MYPTIKNIPGKTLIGMSVNMSLAENKTGQLFRTFIPRKREIPHTINADIFDLRTYPEDYFLQFQPTATFTKWALAEVSTVDKIPPGMEVFTLQGGMYAMFLYKGLSTDTTIFQYIFTEWLPKSEYLLDNRPHFEVLGEKTKLNDPNSEEEIWVPIRLKGK